jgi:hypothetical protein
VRPPTDTSESVSSAKADFGPSWLAGRWPEGQLYPNTADADLKAVSTRTLLTPS